MKILALALCAASLYAADASTQAFQRELKNAEGEFVPLVEAMPAQQFSFAPTQGAFQGVRTFAAQAKHVAAVLNILSASLLGEAAPADENGPETVAQRDVVKYVQAAFAHAQKAVGTLTAANVTEEIPNPFNSKAKTTRLAVANEMLWHTFDHYGQMVVYARMNNVVPPASR